MRKTNKLFLRCAKENEMIYTFAQSQQLYMQTGCVGYLRGDFGHGNEFYTAWFDTAPFRKTPEFQSEFSEVITAFREDPQYRGILHNLEDMKMLCTTRPQSKMPDRLREHSYAFRADTEKHAYLIRLFPQKGDYNLYIYAYQREHFERHLEKATSGIRFITPDYEERFKIPDGDQILITTSDGAKTTRTCRYIDDYHLEVGSNLYHICEFAEKMEQAKNTVIPLRSALPDQCFAFVESENRIAVIKKGESGYYPIETDSKDAEQNKAFTKLLNAQSGVSPKQAEAMKAGSMFGWDTPAADPKNYDDKGRAALKKAKDRGEAR